MMRAFVLALLLLPTAGFAWGPVGHEIVCEIAWQESAVEVRRQINALLAGDRYRTFAAACNWPDHVVKEKAYAWSAPQHYLNVDPSSEHIVMERDCPSTGPGCVLSAISINRRILADTNEPLLKRREALKSLGHFVADVHQPLHVSYARDRGGNGIAVVYFGEPSNLHRVWDSGLISRNENVDPMALAAQISARISPEERREWARSTPLDWAEESYALARDVAYREPPGGWVIDQAYFDAHVQLVHERLAQAGIRLASMLSSALANE